jgi:tetratricopeptide (TPR) repeat protein
LTEKEFIMKKQALTTQQERKMKFAEAGILITLVLALAIFVGIRISSDDQEQQVAATEVTNQEAAGVEVAQGTISEDAQLTDGTAEEATLVVEPEPEIPAVVEPDPEPVTYASAEQMFRTGDYRQAADMFSTYTGDHQANAWGHYMLGLSEWKAGDLDAAEAAFMDALELKPDHLKSLVNYSRVLIEMERNEEAAAQIELALAANPDSQDARRVMARIQHNLGELDQAATSYRQVLSVHQDDVWALNNLGLILISQEKFAEALPPLAKASLLREDIGCIQNNLGIALERSGHYTAAAEAYARALDANHEKAEVSLVRVEGLTEPAGAEPVDLAGLAAMFNAPIQEADLEVASALDATIPADETPEKDGSRNR